MFRLRPVAAYKVLLPVALTLASATFAHAFDRAHDFETQTTGAFIDDRCHFLRPQQRQAIDEFRHALAAGDALRETRSAIEEKARSTAQGVDCARALTPVRDAYEEAAAAAAAAGIAPITRAMSVGKRCLSLSEDDKSALMAAWRQKTDDVAQRYNARIRMKFAMREHAVETEADAISCQKAPALVKAALNPAASKAKP